MARVLNALEIHPGVIRLLRGVPAAGGVTLQLCASESFSGDLPEPEALRQLLQRHGVVGEKVATCLAAGQVNVRDLEFPFREAGKVRDALPFTIEPLLPYPVDRAVLDFYSLGGSGPWQVRAVAVEQSVLEAHLQRLEAAGVSPSVVGEEVSALITGLVAGDALSADGCEAVAVIEGGHALLVFTVDGREELRRIVRWTAAEDATAPFSDLLDLLHAAYVAATAADGPVPSRLVVAGPLAADERLVAALGDRLGLPAQVARLGLASTATTDGRQWTESAFTAYGLLLQASRRVPFSVDFHRTRSPWMRELHQIRRHALGYGIAIGLVVALAAADLYASLTAHNRAYEALREQLRARFVQVMPEGTRVVNETAQVMSRIDELAERVTFFEDLTRPGGQPLYWLNLLSEMVPPDLDLVVKNLTIDGKDIRINGTVDDFKAVERLKGVLRTTPAFASVEVRDAKLSVDQKRVRFQLVLTPGRRGQA
ncbi:MAG: GspL/Epsl periplasmic domain-containing protein [Nitrospirota bacterium]|jgi:type II secretory pathway component PulL